VLQTSCQLELVIIICNYSITVKHHRSQQQKFESLGSTFFPMWSKIGTNRLRNKGYQWTKYMCNNSNKESLIIEDIILLNTWLIVGTIIGMFDHLHKILSQYTGTFHIIFVVLVCTVFRSNLPSVFSSI
jgi:hypothetical protein